MFRTGWDFQENYCHKIRIYFEEETNYILSKMTLKSILYLYVLSFKVFDCKLVFLFCKRFTDEAELEKTLFQDKYKYFVEGK